MSLNFFKFQNIYAGSADFHQVKKWNQRYVHWHGRTSAAIVGAGAEIYVSWNIIRDIPVMMNRKSLCRFSFVELSQEDYQEFGIPQTAINGLLRGVNESYLSLFQSTTRWLLGFTRNLIWSEISWSSATIAACTWTLQSLSLLKTTIWCRPCLSWTTRSQYLVWVLIR